MVGKVNEVDFWRLYSKAGEILFQFSANHEPTRTVLITMKDPKVERTEADLPTMKPN